MSLGFILVLGFTLQGFIARLGAVSRDTTKQLVYRMGMDSLLAYTEAGLKRRWCFTDNWSPEDPSHCDLANTRSSERLMLSPSQIDFINAMIAADPTIPHGNPVNLEQIDYTVDVKNLPGDHPLREIVSLPEFNFVGKIRFLITRLHDSDLPVIGSEAHIQIQIELFPADGKSFPQGRSEMKAWLKTTFFPREIGALALVVPGDMYLDGQSARKLGDVAFPNSPNQEGPGIVFESPVFVNGHVNIPANSAQTYTNVTFSDRLIIGGGVVKQGGKAAAPSTAGGFQTQLSSALVGFGGFQQGTSIDGERDLGLDVFSGLSTGAAADDQMMKACIDRNKVKSDFSRTAGASLLVRSSGEGRFDLSWGKDDFFVGQDTGIRLQTTGQFSSDAVIVGEGASVIGVKLDFQGSVESFTPSAEFNLPSDGDAKIFPRLMLPSSDYKAQLGALKPGTSEYDKVNDLYKAALRAEENPPGVEIKTMPVSVNGTNQPNQLQLQVTLIHPENMNADFSIAINGYDMSFIHGQGQRSGANAIGFNSALNLNYQRLQDSPFSFSPTLQTSIKDIYARADNKPASSADLTVTSDWNQLEVECNPATSNSQLAFQPSGWDYSFASVTRHSWDINPVTGILELNQSNASLTGPPAFLVKSIADQCIIRASANFVTGFFTCDKLTIEARTTPLRIVGTFIVNALSIDPSVYTYGLRWSNIYTPNAVLDLRAAQVLKPKWSSCDPSPLDPIWHPFPTVVRQDDLYNCNSISLRAKADPFTWTTMDPDCGLKPGAPSTTCKRRPVRFSVKEFDRGFSQ